MKKSLSRLEEISKKYNIKPHCISDRILLYLRYLEDCFPVIVKADPDNPKNFKNVLHELYNRYRIIVAEDPTVFMGYGRTLGGPPQVACTIFYSAAIITGNLITQKDVTAALGVGQSATDHYRGFLDMIFKDRNIGINELF